MGLARWIGPLVVLAAVAFGDASVAADRVALVIGNSHYRHAKVLPNPGNDARAIAAKLEALDFHVTPAIDLDLAGTRASLQRFGETSAGSDIALVFYAGHGLQVAGENYLLPVDAAVGSAGDLASAAIPLSEIRATVNAAKPGLFVLILDACRDNPFVGPVSGAPGLASGTFGQPAGRRGPAGLVIAFAAAPGATAEDGEDGNSPFTTALLAWIDQPVEIVDMFRNVQELVDALTAGGQMPWLEQALVPRIYLSTPDPSNPNAVSLEDALLATIRRIADPAERRAGLAYYQRLFPNRTRDVEQALAELDLPPARPLVAEELEAVVRWQSIRDSQNPDDFRVFAADFSGTPYADLAGERLAALESATSTVLVTDAGMPVGRPSTEMLEPLASGPGTHAQPPEPEAVEASLGLGADGLAAVQRMLAQAGQYRGGLDGVLGPMSRAGIRGVQTSAGLPATGFLDRETLRTLVETAGGALLADGIPDDARAAIHRLAAIARRGPGAEPVTVRLQTITPAPEIEALMRDEARRFEAAHPDVIIELRLQPDPDYKRGLLAALGSTTPPDIFYTWGGGHLRAIAEAGFARDLTPEMADWAMQFKPGAIENVSVDGQVFAVPQQMSLVSLWANAPLLRSAGVDPASLATWQGLLEATERLEGAGIVPLAVGGADKWPLQFYWGSLALAVGGRDAFERAMAGAGAGFDDPAFVRAGVLLRQLVALDPFQPGYGDDTAIDAVDAFASGEAAMTLTGDWTLPRVFRRWKGGADDAAAEIVRIDFPPADLAGGESPTYGGVPAWVVRAEAPEAALQFVRQLTGLAAQTRMAGMGFGVPSVAAADTAITDRLQRGVASRLTASTYHQLFYDQELGPAAGDALNDAVVALVKGDLTPERASAEVQAAWERIHGHRFREDAPEPAPAR
jgi:raffinose/stachyose/melibiose transport system substrate-binding protein